MNVGADSSALDLTLRALRPILARSDVTELCINQPGEAFIETRRGWQREPLPFADLDWCRRLAKLVANSTAQRIDEESPLLSASLPSGERIQIVFRQQRRRHGCIDPSAVGRCLECTARSRDCSGVSASSELDEIEPIFAAASGARVRRVSSPCATKEHHRERRHETARRRSRRFILEIRPMNDSATRTPRTRA